LTTHAHNQQTNRLAGETSPYLLQHQHNPVDWYPWGEEALRRAKEEDRPILLSVGYSACHWCHVMERESFENEDIARIMNRLFVNVKVDREERPDIDHLYMSAVQMMAGQGGWPMTVFLTPDGKPFYGGTYYPPDDRYGRPGFPKVLEAVAEAWRSRRTEIEEQGDALVEQIRESSRAGGSESPVTEELFDTAVQRMMQNFDSRLGGFGGAPKFPQPMTLDFLLRYAKRTGSADALHMATFTLERMGQGGIYDHLGGGLHRYSTDAYWLAPHFEKMLYDNAQLVQTCLRAWQATGEPFFRKMAEETLDYVLREMTGSHGGFYSAQDADSEGEEGKFFVWDEDEVKEVLGPEDAAVFARVYDVTPRGNWEHKNILNLSAPVESLARSFGVDEAQFVERIAAMKAKLLARRETRVHPGTDEKVLTSWNGLMLAAMADAAALLERDDYLSAARRNAEFILGTLHADGRLLRTGKQVEDGFKVASIPGFLEDYAYFADGLLHLFEADFDPRWLETARALADTMLRLFLDENGDFYNTPTDGEALVDRPREITDNATPAGNSVAMDVLLRLAVLTGNEEYRAVAEKVIGKSTAMMARHPQAFGRLLSAADFLVGPARELVIVGDPASEEVRALLRVARAEFRPNLVIAAAAPGSPLSEMLPLFEGRAMLENRPTAYVCENYACRQPVTTPAALAEQLAGP
jgi:hypothetical protein